MTMFVLFIALLPIALLGYYIWVKDKMFPEPASQLIKAFAFGVLSVFLSMCISIPFRWLGLYSSEPVTVIGNVLCAFFGAAIPEEAAKLCVLYFLLANNSHFDEKMDGIVYAVFVSLGFAALENVLYLFSNYDSFISVGIPRALFAVPGHFCFGITMGYYISMAAFKRRNGGRYFVLAFLAPMLLHGVYDSILFVSDSTPVLSTVLTFVFLLFCHKMWKYTAGKVREFEVQS